MMIYKELSETWFVKGYTPSTLIYRVMQVSMSLKPTRKPSQPLWNIFWQFLKNLKIELLYDPAMLLLGTYTGNENIYSYDNLYVHIYSNVIHNNQASQVSLVVKNPSANTGDARDEGLIPESGKSLGGRNSNLLSILAWRIPWREAPGGHMGLQRVGRN